MTVGGGSFGFCARRNLPPWLTPWAATIGPNSGRVTPSQSDLTLESVTDIWPPVTTRYNTSRVGGGAELSSSNAGYQEDSGSLPLASYYWIPNEAGLSFAGRRVGTTTWVPRATYTGLETSRNLLEELQRGAARRRKALADRILIQKAFIECLKEENLYW